MAHRKAPSFVAQYVQRSVRAMMRQRELSADRAAALLTGRPSSLLHAVESCTSSYGSPSTDLREVAGVAFVANGRHDADTHPSTAERAAVLARVATALGVPYLSFVRPPALARDEPDVEPAGHATGDEVRGAAGENHATDMRELQDGLGDLLLERPERRMQADEFADDGLCFRDAVLWEVVGELRGQLMMQERLREEILVEEHPALAFPPELLVQHRHEHLADRRGAGADLARKRDERRRLDR